MDENRALSEREECEALLAWYVTGRLSAADIARVDACLARHPDMRRQLGLIGEDREAVVRAHNAIVAPRRLAADQLVARLPKSRVSRLAALASTPFDLMRNFLTAPSPGAVRWVALAALAIVLGQAAVIGTLMRSGSELGYQTASGGAVNKAGTNVLVRFHASAGMDLISAELSKRGMRIVDGPKPGQLYVVEIGPPTMSDTERLAREADLRGLTGLISSVLSTSA
ncbi:MAG: hypothetical protein CTY20_08745 [Hyphomicrobium sp.]|nr:MAG: hypothetical protein CTY20_08745 [Hyphomicrobium sp.]